MLRTAKYYIVFIQAPLLSFFEYIERSSLFLSLYTSDRLKILFSIRQADREREVPMKKCSIVVVMLLAMASLAAATCENINLDSIDGTGALPAATHTLCMFIAVSR